ncbi:MAG: alpha-L-fucosidase, partial [Verrucomicrobiota bacterium]
MTKTHLKSKSVLLVLLCASISVSEAHASVDGEQAPNEPQKIELINPGFEDGQARKTWKTRKWGVNKNTDIARSGKSAVQMGPERARVGQMVEVKPNSLYRVTAWVKTQLASEQVELYAMKFGGPHIKAVSSPLTEWNQLTLEFETGTGIKEVLIGVQHPGGPGVGYADDVEMYYLGPAPPPAVQKFVIREPRELKSDGGVEQLPDEDIEWFFQDKLGMFIHWGVYAAMDEGAEWVMYWKKMPPDVYRKRAEDPETGFTAKDFNAKDWVDLAKDAGMRYMVLTTRHHDGYALFDSQHENAWTSQQQLGRDLVREYVDAVREADLRVGLYYSPMSWRYPGYFDPYGTGAKPNRWNYQTSPANKESARVMREEVYEQVTNLMKNYGKIDYMFWD